MTPGSTGLVRELQPLADRLAALLEVAIAIVSGDGRILLAAGRTEVDGARAGAPTFDARSRRIDWGAAGEAPDLETVETPLRAPDGAGRTLWLLRRRASGADPHALAHAFEQQLAALQARQAEVDGMAAELLESYEEINRFYELARVFDAATSEHELCDILLRQVLEATGGDGGAVMLLDGDAAHVVTLAGDVEPALCAPAPPTLAAVDQALRRGIASSVSGSAQGTPDRFTRASIVVPLPIKGTPAGAMIIQRGDRTPFHAGDAKVAQSMGSQAGVFLNNLRQAGRLIEAARVSRDIEVAETFQRQLLPTDELDIRQLQTAAAYLATNQIGGDYYDLLRVSPTALCVIVADVSGHSITSGLLMTAARSVARLLVQQGLAPDEILRRLNEVLYDDLDRSGHFISLFCLRLDVQTGQGSYASAGHNPPYWRSARDGAVKVLDATGPLIGVFDDAAFDHERLTLAPGDALVLYTDGIPEARDPQGALFGEPRLEALVAATGDGDAQQVVEAIMGELRRHQPGRLADDVTLVVLKAGAPADTPGPAAATDCVVHRVDGSLDNVPRLRHWLEARLADWGLPPAFIADLALAATEVCTNVARHGYAGGTRGDIEVELTREDGAVRVCVLDTAAPFEPPSRVRGATGALAEGGYGLALIHDVADEVRYERREPIGNRVVLVKRLPRS